MGFGVNGVFSVGFDDEIWHSFGFKMCASLRSAHIKFLKEKEKKKVVIQVKVSRKASFLEKILPEWVEIFSKTRRA